MHLNVPDHGVSKFNSNIPRFGTFTQSRKLIEGRLICVNCQPHASKSAFFGSVEGISPDHKIELGICAKGGLQLVVGSLNEIFWSSLN